ncbi:MAG: hypothetical protein AB1529_02505 [Candidatus Micrarchaeota archaeon]
MVSSTRKGQGATEYLVILAVVLIVALVVIALLGFFPGVGGAARESQSASYWSGAQPFSITSFKLDNTSVTLVMSNRLSEKLTLTEVAFDGDALTNVTNTTFKGGEERSVSGTLGSTCGASGDGFEYDVVLTFNQGGISGKKQFGDKPLVGKCT